MRARVTILGSLLAIICLFHSRVASAAEPIDFKRDIQPIFEQRCYECHGEKKQKSGLRLDRKAAVFKGGDSGKPRLSPARVRTARSSSTSRPMTPMK
jgi:hypothetical protein